VMNFFILTETTTSISPVKGARKLHKDTDNFLFNTVYP
jgi:hypothetical protein